nr:copia protein [Tanacetum cinerariifolium]
PDGKIAIGTKWILKNKRDARGIAVRNKARLVTQGHRQEEGINYDEVFALVSRIEAIRIFLAFASYMGFMVYQMDVKSAFLNGEIKEEVYVTQPKGFEDPHNPKHVYRVVIALYGLHQVPSAWYARLSTFLLKHHYRRGTIDKILFLKKDSRHIILVQVYMDDIIFSSTNKAWCDEFEVLMKGEFKMSAMGELTFFLGLQVKQLPDGIFISQDKYVKDMLKKFDMKIHVLEMVDGRVIHMFVDVSYPLTIATLERMLKHGLEVPKLLVGGDLTMAEQLNCFIKAALLNAQAAV